MRENACISFKLNLQSQNGKRHDLGVISAFLNAVSSSYVNIYEEKCIWKNALYFERATDNLVNEQYPR